MVATAIPGTWAPLCLPLNFGKLAKIIETLEVL